jgi:hypothetical protein
MLQRNLLSLSSGKIKHITLPSSVRKMETLEFSEILVRQYTKKLRNVILRRIVGEHGDNEGMWRRD